MPRLMALDVGAARIGVAVSDESGFLASPYTTLHVTRDEEATWAAIQEVIAEVEPVELVIGLPVSLDGQIHAQAERIMAFTERLKTAITLPVVFWDERLSTVEAERLLSERGQKPRERRQGKGGRGGQGGARKRKRRGQQEIDALAAAVILQSYLDEHSSRRVTLSNQMGDERE